MKVDAGIDQLSGQELWLRETVGARATRRKTEREAEKVRTWLLNQVGEQRSPRTGATVHQLLDQYLEVVEIDLETRASYVGKIDKHVRPVLGKRQVGAVKADDIVEWAKQRSGLSEPNHDRGGVGGRTPSST